ncbi:MAG TPA: formimidoylglutamate deiminase [Nocardioidaceae bacterium]|nr:formimidoylglutamate deiminase [Nocardioidaceae bacterium]
MATFWLQHAWLGAGEVVDGVLVTVEDERFASVEVGVVNAPEGAHRLVGLTVPGLANCHSHAFHRALRGRTQRERGTFWTWREQMYALAERLDPDSYYDLARGTYREMLLAGYTSVGEFHYLHHRPGGAPYDNPNAMGLAMIEAARDAGIRITLLDTCYVAAGIGQQPAGVQTRFSDGTAERWASRLERLEYSAGDDAVLGAAVHSVRAVPPGQMRLVAEWAEEHGVPLHVHLSEQRAENDACLAAYNLTPTGVLEEAGVLGERTSAIHATHLTAEDVEALGRTRTFACFCPTTERDLGDGIGPSRALLRSGSPLTIGSDSHAVIDPFEEMRAVELDERLARQERGHWSAAELLTAATADGHRSLGFADVGRIEVGARADLVTLDLRSPRTAGSGASAESAVFAAGAADVTQVIRDGQVVATAGDRGEVAIELDSVINKLWEETR